jgi:hypothetical protein
MKETVDNDYGGRLPDEADFEPDDDLEFPKGRSEKARSGIGSGIPVVDDFDEEEGEMEEDV